MDFLLNELSLHGQFSICTDFYAAVETLMTIRTAIRRAGRDLYCHRNLANAQVTAEQTMPQAIQNMEHSARQAWILWLTRRGPFWVDQRRHAEDEWLEVEDGTIVTDSGVGETAFCLLHDLPRAAVTIDPSDWLRNPVVVTWRKNDREHLTVDVPNHWTLESVEETLETLPLPFDSWVSLEEHLRNTCDSLIFSDDFMRLDGYPYVMSVGEWIYILVGVLNKLSDGLDDDGKRTEKANELYEVYFKGDAPYFTDESTQNKNNFCQQMTFNDPRSANVTVFCPWHGKVNSPTNFPPIRIHFTWPLEKRGDLFVAYIGPKITM